MSIMQSGKNVGISNSMENNRDSDNQFVKYTLSSDSLERINSVKNNSARNESRLRDAWRSISWEEPDTTVAKEDNDNAEEAEVEAEVKSVQSSQEEFPQLTQATQYGFTQADRSDLTSDSVTSIGNLTDLIYEALERVNGKVEVNLLRGINDSELSIIVGDLTKKLSYKGIYNLCHSICAMQTELSERFIGPVCKDLLLTVITSNEEPSRLLNAAITECVTKFPEDVENLVFVPSLDFDVKEISTILSITGTIDAQQKRAYISDFSTAVKDLKQWHIPVLQDLIVDNMEDNTKEKILNLLWNKSYDFSKDKNYGKLVISFLKTNPPTTDEQKHLFEEIAAVNNPLFKKLISKILDGV